MSLKGMKSSPKLRCAPFQVERVAGSQMELEIEYR